MTENDIDVLRASASTTISTRGTGLEVASQISFEKRATPEAVLFLVSEIDRLKGSQAVSIDFLGALARFREAFVIAVGDKSPFAKCALSELDAAIAKARGEQ